MEGRERGSLLSRARLPVGEPEVRREIDGHADASGDDDALDEAATPACQIREDSVGEDVDGNVVGPNCWY